MAKKKKTPVMDFNPDDLDSSSSSDAMKLLSTLAAKAAQAQGVVLAAEAKLKEAKEKLSKIIESQIPDLMKELDVKEFTSGKGVQLSLTETIRCGIKEDNQKAAFAFLEKYKFGEMIKRTVLVQFGKGEIGWAKQFEKDIKKVAKEEKRLLNVKTGMKVENQTLKKWVKTRFEEGDVPFDEDIQKLFGVYRQDIAVCKVPKKKEAAAKPHRKPSAAVAKKRGARV